MTEVVPYPVDAAACDWYADRYQSIFVSRNRWLVTAILALGLSLAQAIALIALVPLKDVRSFRDQRRSLRGHHDGRAADGRQYASLIRNPQENIFWRATSSAGKPTIRPGLRKITRRSG